MRYWSGPGFGRMSGGLAHSAPVFLYTKPSSSSSCILSRINFSYGGAYLRADIRTGYAPSRSLMTRGFSFAGGFAPSLSLNTSLHSVTNCRKLCTPSLDILACSALVIKPSVASASSSGLPCPEELAVYIMVIYWVIIRNVSVEKSLIPEARKLYVGL
jgi:hypothetical protein